MENNGMVPVLVPPQFAKFMAEFFGDKRNVLWPVANISKLPLPLDVAQPFAEKEIEGDFIYADSDSTGVIYVRFNNPAMPEIPVRTNFGIYGFPIKRIFVRWDAQAGKQLNLLYGYGAQVIPPNQDITTIGSITNPVTLAKWLGKNRLYSPGFISGDVRIPVNVANIQLWNPAGSGVNLYLDKINWIMGTASEAFFYRHNAALTTLSAAGQSKTVNGAAGAGEIRYQDAAAAIGTQYPLYLSSSNVAQNETVFEEPIIIPPGNGIHMRGAGAGSRTAVNFEWREGA